MKKILGILALSSTLVACAGGLSQEQTTTLETDGVKLGLCVTVQLLSGVTDPAEIAKNCLVPLTPDVLKMIETAKPQVAAMKASGACR